MDAIVPPPILDGRPVVVAVPPVAVQEQQQQQRPSLSFFSFLAILFFLISNNNPKGNRSVDDTTAMEQYQQQLNKTQLERDSLARWLGVNATLHSDLTSSSTTNSLLYMPDRHMNPLLLQEVHRLMDRDAEQEFVPLYHQNLTGFVRGDWRSSNRSLALLGLEEMYNVTAWKKAEIVMTGQGDGEVKEEDGVAMDEAMIAKRQTSESTLIDSSSSNTNASASSVAELVSYNTTMNRTQMRTAEYDWLRGGKVSFNLREEQTSAVIGLDPSRNVAGGELLRVDMEHDSELEAWQKEGPVTYLRGEITFESASKGEQVLDLESVHFLDQGTFYGFLTPTTSRSRIFDVPGLASFDPSYSNATSIAAGHVVLKQVDRRIALSQKEDAAAASSNTVESSGSPCVFTIYGRISPLPASYSLPLYAEYVSSLFHPTGANVVAAPPATISYIMYSEACGLVIEGKGESSTSMRLWERAVDVGSILALVHVALLILLVREMESSSATGTFARVSYLTIAAQATMDCYSFIIVFTIGLVTNNRSSLCLLVSAFCMLLSFALFGLRYTSLTLQSSVAASIARRALAPAPPSPPPPPTREELAADAAESRANASAAAQDGHPLFPPAVPISTRPTFAFSAATVDEDNVVLSIKGGILLASILCIWRYGWIPFLTILLYSYWVPQIVLNITRGAARMSLTREYVIGTTLCRLILPMYIWGCPSNLLSMEVSKWSIVLLLYSISQAAILLLQDTVLTPSFFVPQSVLDRFHIIDEKVWDYYAPMPPRDLEATGDDVLDDCAICMEPITWAHPSKEDREFGAVGAIGGVVRQRDFVLPPCHHIAHAACLSQWLAIKSVCPTCRRPLPAM